MSRDGRRVGARFKRRIPENSADMGFSTGVQIGKRERSSEPSSVSVNLD